MEYYKTFNSKDAQDMGLEQVIDIIRQDGELKKNTQLYRDLSAQGNEKAAKAVKESTPQVAVSFRMAGGKGKDNCGECLYQVLVDFDAKSPEERLPAHELERVKTFLRTSYHARAGYESISGLGYHIVVPFVLPEGIGIDMAADAKRAEDIYTRVYMYIVRLYSFWTGHDMDRECKNVNRMMGLSHDPIAVYRPDATPIRPTREELGIDKDGRLVKMKTPRHAVDQKGNAVGVHLGDHMERAMKMMEDADITFTPGNRHNYIMRLSFVLNRMGVNEDEAAQALDDNWLGQMDGRPSDVLHNCYKTAADEFGVWMPKRSNTAIKTEAVAAFLKTRKLQYDVLTQKTRQQADDGWWHEMKERDENNLFNTLPYDGMYAQARYLLENGFNYWFDETDIHALELHVDEFMIPTNEEQLIPIYFSPARLEDGGSVFLTLAEISAKIVAYGNLKKTPEPRRLGAIMTKLGFEKERIGHDRRTGYYVQEHTLAEIERMRHPEIF